MNEKKVEDAENAQKNTGTPSRAKDEKPRTRIRGASRDALKRIYPDGVPKPKGPGPGRPVGSADVWTPEHIAEVTAAIYAYVEKTACPSVAEFCYTHGVRIQRLSEFPSLGEARDALNAKRLAYIEKAGLKLNKDHGQRGTFLLRMAANVGAYSLTEKQDLEHSGSVAVKIVDDIQ